MTLAVVSSHPIQYHAPVYRALQTQFGVPVTAVYGSDFSIVGYQDREFGVEVAWDTDLVSGYKSLFLSQVATGGAQSVEEVSARGVGQALEQIQPRAVLLIGYSLNLYRAAFWQTERLRLPLLFRAEVNDHARARHRWKAIVRDQTLRLFYRRCAAALYVGQRALNHYRRLGCAEEKLFFSPYCVDITPFKVHEADRASLRTATRASLHLTEERRVVLFCGKLAPNKGPDLALKAIKLLPADLRHHTTLMYLGDGEMRNRLHAFAKEQPVVDVRFLGFQNQRSLSQYYHAGDVLILPSQGETWGLVVNEALHHGIPCVVSDAVGCAPDLIQTGRTGAIYQSGDLDDLARKLESELGKSNDETLRGHCRQRVSGYTVARAAEGIAQAYRWVVDSGKGFPL